MHACQVLGVVYKAHSLKIAAPHPRVDLWGQVYSIGPHCSGQFSWIRARCLSKLSPGVRSGGVSEMSELEVLCLVLLALRKMVLNRWTRKLTPGRETRQQAASVLVMFCLWFNF